MRVGGMFGLPRAMPRVHRRNAGRESQLYESTREQRRDVNANTISPRINVLFYDYNALTVYDHCLKTECVVCTWQVCHSIALVAFDCMFAHPIFDLLFDISALSMPSHSRRVYELGGRTSQPGTSVSRAGFPAPQEPTIIARW